MLTYQHPTSGASSICPTHDEGVVHLLNDGDEIIALHLQEKERMSLSKRKRETQTDENWKEGDIYAASMSDPRAPYMLTRDTYRICVANM